jgi:hypothetical protein
MLLGVAAVVQICTQLFLVQRDADLEVVRKGRETVEPTDYGVDEVALGSGNGLAIWDVLGGHEILRLVVGCAGLRPARL